MGGSFNKKKKVAIFYTLIYKIKVFGYTVNTIIAKIRGIFFNMSYFLLILQFYALY